MANLPLTDTLTLTDLRVKKDGYPGQNKSILTCLEKLVGKTEDKMRASSFTKAIKAIKGVSFEITSGTMAKAQIPGIGKGIADRIDEILKTGTLAELERCSPEEVTVKDLCTVTGIGPVKAKRLIADYAVKDVPDLIKKYKSGQITVKPNALTQHITVGLDYYYDLLERFSRDEADRLIALLRGHLSTWTDVKMTVCGSYRRGLENCGDLDVILCSAVERLKSNLLKGIVEKLTQVKFLTGNLTEEGTTKYMGVCKLPAGKGRRIDIRVIPTESMGAALLYFTGSGEFNVRMRNAALKGGYTLNEYGLYRLPVDKEHESTLIPCATEEEIFAHLKLVYIPPKERA
jgi:DNA polymerase/3'-5' exonuclease PolX